MATVAMVLLAGIARAEAPRLGPERHPVALFDDAGTVRARIAREPYAGWWKALEARAAACGEPEADEGAAMAAAKTLAFVAAVGGKDAPREAARARLARLTERIDWNAPKAVHHETNVLYDALVAYDLCAGGDDAAIRRPLAKRLEALVTYDPGWYKAHLNNWQVRQFSVLALGGIILGNQAWYELGRAWTMKSLRWQTTGDGGHAEGHSYLDYSAARYLPFFHANLHATRENLFALKWVQALHRWPVLTRLPDGLRPNQDDSEFALSFSRALTSADPDGLLRWDADTAPQMFDGSPEGIAWFDDAPAPAPPDFRCVFLEEAGDGVLRSGWERDAVCLAAKAEHGPARARGAGHEHADDLSFLVQAYGENLALDGGYLDYERHARVNTPDNHNLVLADGKGPSAEDGGWIRETFDLEGLGACRLESPGLSRWILLVDGRHVVVLDEGAAPDGVEWTWLLHGNARGEAFSLLADGALWKRPSGVALRCWTTGALSAREDEHSVDRQPQVHAVLEARQRGASFRNAAWLEPLRAGEAAPAGEVKDGAIAAPFGRIGPGAVLEGEGFLFSAGQVACGRLGLSTDDPVALALVFREEAWRGEAVAAEAVEWKVSEGRVIEIDGVAGSAMPAGRHSIVVRASR